jgi:hypothetical protein
MVWMGHNEQSPGEIAEVERGQLAHDLEARAEEGAQREQRVHEARAAGKKRPLIKRIKRWLRRRRRSA